MQHAAEAAAATPGDESAAALLLPPLEQKNNATLSIPLLASAPVNGPLKQPHVGEKERDGVVVSRADSSPKGVQHIVTEAAASDGGVGTRTLLAKRVQKQQQQQHQQYDGEDEYFTGSQDEDEGKDEWEEEEEAERDGEGSWKDGVDAEVEVDDDDHGGELPSNGGKNGGLKKDIFIVQGKRYTASAIVPNLGFTVAQEKLRANPKTTFTACSVLKTHDIMSCRHLHLTNRAVLVGNLYVRINTLVNNPARVALLTNPEMASEAMLCTVRNDRHEASTCTSLHLLPGIVFVGSPELQVGYFEAELHENLALQRLKDGIDTCGRWCKSRRSHILVTCGFVHYKWGNVYTEVARMPPKLLALFPNMRPRATQAGGGRDSDSVSRGRGRGGGRGCGRGRGGHSAGRGGACGDHGIHDGTLRSRGSVGDSTKGHDVVELAPLAGKVGGALAAALTEAATPASEEVQARGVQLLNLLLALLAVVIALLAYSLS